MEQNLSCCHTTQPSQGRTVLFSYLRNLKWDGIIDEATYSKILPCGSTAGVLYGLPKVHKTGCPFRRIVSAVNTYNYNLASFLVNVLKPISTNQFTIKDSFTFVDWVKAHQHNNEIMCSFDVCSLFTNVPLDETIEISLTKLYSLPDPPSLPRHVPKNCFCLQRRKATSFLMVIITIKSMVSLWGLHSVQY